MDKQSSLTPAEPVRERAKSVGTPWGADSPQKMLIQDILYEYMYSGDADEAIRVVEQKKIIEGAEFTKRALIFGIERQSYERELVSVLLSKSYDIFGQGKGGGEIASGFQLMLHRLPDLVLDVPDAPNVLAKFISRAIYDEILPPAWIKDAQVDNDRAKEAMSLAFATTHSTDEKRRLEHIWGPGDRTSVESLKIAVDDILIEYISNPDIPEATRSVKELNVPSFAGQIVKRAIVKAIEHNTEACSGRIIDLLEHWLKINLMTSGSMKRGFGAAWRQLDDIKLDVPVAPKVMDDLQAAAIAKKILPADFKPLLEDQ